MDAKEIIYKSLDEIVPYENNPRLNDVAVDAVANSILAFGFKNPIQIDASGVIIAGHTRYKAAQKLGLKIVPCIINDDLTEDEARAFRLADNKTGELAEWDMDLLDAEIAEIDTFDMQDFGFENDDGISYLDILENDVLSGSGINERSEFAITFQFPIEAEENVQKYVKGKGKAFVTAKIMKEAEEYAICG